MDWLAPIDAYCERIDPGLFAEPLNALSNVAFFIAAIWGAKAARAARADWPVWVLVILVGLIGAGSLAFHMFANRLSVFADILPITVFIYFYLGFVVRRLLQMNWPAIVASLLALLAVTALLERVTPPGFFNGSGPYLPPLAASLVVSLGLRFKGHPA